MAGGWNAAGDAGAQDTAADAAGSPGTAAQTGFGGRSRIQGTGESISVDRGHRRNLYGYITIIRRERREGMSINLIFRIAAVGILVSVMGQILKHAGREEQAFLVSLSGLILVLLWVIPYILELFRSIQELFSL